METGLLILFFYGILHSFGPDHLVVIANFSIGKQSKAAFANVLLFAVGHGLMLLVFAKILSLYPLPEWVTASGDLIAASVICLMGAYLLYMALTNQIQFRQHMHEGKPHIHIWFGKAHEHDKKRQSVRFGSRRTDGHGRRARHVGHSGCGGCRQHQPLSRGGLCGWCAAVFQPIWWRGIAV